MIDGGIDNGFDHSRFEFLSVVTTKNTVFWDVPPYSLVETYWLNASKFLPNYKHCLYI
jgi:hypothetical protein